MNSIFMALMIMLASTGAMKSPASATHVTIDVKATAPLKAGSTGELAVVFHPKKGIHVNTDPAIEITPEGTAVIASVSAITPSKNAKGYVDASKPVKASASVAASAPKGPQTVKLKVVYFLCSDAEGWCNREEQTLDVHVTVK